MRVRSVDVGPSSGTTMVGDEMRDGADFRDARVCADDLREIREVAELRAVVFPGISSGRIGIKEVRVG